MTDTIMPDTSFVVAINSAEMGRGYYTGKDPMTGRATFTNALQYARRYKSERGASRILNVLSAYEAAHPHGDAFEVQRLSFLPAQV